ncbi:MAG: enoyl-CoA hydratase/isomerase family protein [Deltaproteobacteria bacterium]|nr:enoyl-CoA hydratase/isomerase family protein [Deltaproteobacteria bacterium]
MNVQSGMVTVVTEITGSSEGVRVGYEPAHALLRVTIDNGPGNRIGLAQVGRLLDIATRLSTLESAADECRVVVLDAVGADFSHGANLSDPALIARLSEGHDARLAFARRGQELVSRWRAIPVPTIAVATGQVVGAGACLFMASDFRIAAPATAIRFPEIDRGMHLGWGIVPRLLSLLGEPRTLKLALLGEALDVSDLADTVTVACDPPGEVLCLAAGLAAKAPLAVRAILDVLRQSQLASGAGADTDAERWADTLASADFAEAMAAWYGRRAANWKGR